jgi:nitroreductase
LRILVAGFEMEVAEAIRARRAKRVLTERRIEDDKIGSLVEAARLSASCFNNQPWRMVFCRGKESLEAAKSALAKGNVWATRADTIIVVVAKETDDCQLSDRRNYYLFDCGLAVGQLLLRAADLGFIAHPIAGYDPVKVRELLGIPDDYVVITFIICAYEGTDDSLLSDKQKGWERERPERKPANENFFLDRWGRPFA